MTDKFAIFIDIDGTLAANGKVNPKNDEIIKKARAMGHYVFVNSGRARSFINDELIGGIAFDGFISGIGSQVDIGDKAIFEQFISPEFIYECAKRFHDSGKCYSFSGHENTFVRNPFPYFLRWGFPIIEDFEDFNEKYKGAKIQKIEIFASNVSAEDKRFLEKETDLYDHGNYIECVKKGCSKSRAMGIALEYLGIKRENSIAIGDSLNDIDMLKNAGIAVAVANAVPEVKALADFVSVSCDDGGVGYAIEKLVLKEY